MSGPRRREQRRTHLDASTVPVERALIARAQGLAARAAPMPPGSDTSHILLTIAAEYTALAEELHWWD